MSLRKTGAQAVEEERRIEEEAEIRKSSKKEPIRFRINSKSDDQKFAVVTILDDIKDLQDIPRYWEHNVYNQQNPKASYNALCTAELGHCDLCEKGESRSFIAFLSIANYMNKYNDKTVDKYYRQLLPIKQQSKERFYQYFRQHIKKYGTLRGMTLFLYRKEPSNDFPVIGEPSILNPSCSYQAMWEDFFTDDNEMIQPWVHVEDDFITTEYDTPELVDRDGNSYQKAGSETRAYDYDVVFEEPDMGNNKSKVAANTPVPKSKTKTSNPAPKSKAPPKAAVNNTTTEEYEDPYADLKEESSKAPPKSKKAPKAAPPAEEIVNEDMVKPDEVVEFEEDDLDKLFDV